MVRFTPLQVIKRGFKALKKEFASDNQTVDHIETNNNARTYPLQVPKKSPQIKKKAETQPQPHFSPFFAKGLAHPIPAVILVMYLDEKQNYLMDPQIVRGYRGQEFELVIKNFPDYYVTNIAGFTTSFVDRYGVVKILYQRRNAAALWIFAKDIDEQRLLAAPEFVHGKLHAPYSLSAPSFANYVLVQAHGPVTGRFLNSQQFVTYFYRKKWWEEVDESLRLLKIIEFTECVDAPYGKRISLTLAKDTVWQAFKSVKTTDKTIWYCLGGNTWIKQNKNIKVLTHRNHLEQPSPADTSLKNYATPIQTQARIDFVPGKKVTLYDKPCGKKSSQLKHGTVITLTAHKHLAGMHWYQIDNDGWILQEYLRF